MKVLLQLSTTLIAGLLAVPSLAKEPGILLRNGDMEEGDSVPAGWIGKFGQCEVRKDTLWYHGGKASMVVDRSAMTDNGRGCIHQMILLREPPKEANPAVVSSATPSEAKAPITPPGPLKIKVSGWLRTGVDAKATFAAHFFDDKHGFSELVPIAHVEKFQDWQQAQAEIDVPPQATRVALSLYLEGKSRAWLDDVAITVTPESSVKEIAALNVVSAPKSPKEPGDVTKVPTTAVPGYYPEQPHAWQAFHESFVRRARQGGIDVLFLGDSITQGWSTTGEDPWEKHFAPFKAANFGLGGDKTGNVLWRIENGELEGISPKVVVLMIGMNNLWDGKNTSTDIVTGIRTIVDKLRAKLPQSKVLILGLPPSGADPMGLDRVRIAQVNTEAAGIGNGAEVRFLDLFPRFLTRNGTLVPGAYAPDNVHLTAQGYAILAEELRPWVEQMMK
ncbi:lysophospholipase L1-like esterase [Roseimicrobium gellanilyticum]|uniref:Lysophospholipase L1-like esterase n=1 Tax=Roseimicrobium gellanilyticum TaxID=748857 RepID=A0A366H0V9_9BACT|nr:GDSL-type esterase/lipase family protein [Roseimicrobium gellanilyticum]RBP35375.1 lysophospholipase L1-like esterase [Roseimicrobium gellanilyticum]